jgi:hypothetical protein
MLRVQLNRRVSSVQSSELNSVKWFFSGTISVILDCNYDFCVFNKSIKVIWNPLIISDATQTSHTMF